MIKLFTEDEFNNAKSQDKLPLKCEQCGETFYVQKKYLSYCLTHISYSDRNRFCSDKCSYESRKRRKLIKCAQCGEIIEKNFSVIKKSRTNLFFCSSSCAATYNNNHKTYGNRRSKLEKYIENELNNLYPNLEILYNNKEIINSELDIYIPSLKLAFELNGIVHYEPIYGEEKLNKIKSNDNNKFQLCIEQKISLCVIDTSSLNYFKEQNAKKFLDIIVETINDKLCNN